MSANLNYGAGAGTVTVSDLRTNRTFKIRDRTLGSPACP